MKNTQQSICALICQSDGIKARDIAKKLDQHHLVIGVRQEFDDPSGHIPFRHRPACAGLFVGETIENILQNPECEEGEDNSTFVRKKVKGVAKTTPFRIGYYSQTVTAKPFL